MSKVTEPVVGEAFVAEPTVTVYVIPCCMELGSLRKIQCW
jgi:hypothetical protein